MREQSGRNKSNFVLPSIYNHFVDRFQWLFGESTLMIMCDLCDLWNLVFFCSINSGVCTKFDPHTQINVTRQIEKKCNKDWNYGSFQTSPKKLEHWFSDENNLASFTEFKETANLALILCVILILHRFFFRFRNFNKKKVFPFFSNDSLPNPNLTLIRFVWESAHSWARLKKDATHESPVTPIWPTKQN